MKLCYKCGHETTALQDKVPMCERCGGQSQDKIHLKIDQQRIDRLQYLASKGSGSPQEILLKLIDDAYTSAYVPTESSEYGSHDQDFS